MDEFKKDIFSTRKPSYRNTILLTADKVLRKHHPWHLWKSLPFSMQQTLNTQLFKHHLNLHKLVFLLFSIISIFTSEGLRSYDSSKTKSY